MTKTNIGKNLGKELEFKQNDYLPCFKQAKNKKSPT